MSGVIDTVALVYPCTAFHGDRLVKFGRGHVLTAKLPGGGFVVEQQPHVTRVEFSVARRLRRPNTSLATVRELQQVLPALLADAAAVAPASSSPVDNPTVARLDVARDFLIDSDIAEGLLDGLRFLARANGFPVKDQGRPNRGDWLRAGRSRWSVVAYVKSAAQDGGLTVRIEPRGTRRFFESAFAAKNDLALLTVANISDERAGRSCPRDRGRRSRGPADDR